MSVIKSARCMARTREKCPTSAERSVFCLSMANEDKVVCQPRSLGGGLPDVAAGRGGRED